MSAVEWFWEYDARFGKQENSDPDWEYLYQMSFEAGLVDG